MSGKTVIFGAYGGIGSALVEQLHQQDIPMHLVGRNENKLAALAEKTRSTYTLGDVMDDNLFSKAAEEAGPEIDGLVYAVGTLNLRSLNRLSAADFLQDYKINALGAALAVQAFLPALKQGEQPGAVVFFSSVAASQGFSFHASIGMAKGAINGLTLSLAAELAPKVRVNAIAPSLTQTPLANSITDTQKLAEAISKMHALQRLGRPEDIANLTAFLLSPQSGWITGQIIGVDGGRSTLRTKA